MHRETFPYSTQFRVRGSALFCVWILINDDIIVGVNIFSINIFFSVFIGVKVDLIDADSALICYADFFFLVGPGG